MFLTGRVQREKPYHGYENSRSKHPRAEAGHCTTSTNKSLDGPPRPRDLLEGPGRDGQMYRGERALASEAALLGTHLSQKLKGYILLFRHTGLGQSG